MTDLDSCVGAVVPAEIRRDLQVFADMVIKWNSRINLISRGTEHEIWSRHVLDSAQIWALCPAKITTWADLGSGGGFPALILSIFAKQLRPDIQFFLIESDRRKAAFLLQATRELGLNCTIRAERIESVVNLNVDVISARALAPLSELLSLCQHLRRPDTVLIFPKGERAEDEISSARKHWRFHLEQIKSVTNPAASLLRITDVRHV